MIETYKYNQVIETIGTQNKGTYIKLDEIGIDKFEIRDIVKKIENDDIFIKGKSHINFGYSFNGLTDAGEFYLKEVIK
ncbi:MAG: hypothetical protein U9R39_03845 [Campylobacterota bacterium]|nr:hypothetical protein [Campylobacterota bacterium]